jgi:hypothetical protein
MSTGVKLITADSPDQLFFDVMTFRIEQAEGYQRDWRMLGDPFVSNHKMVDAGEETTTVEPSEFSALLVDATGVKNEQA